MRESYYKAEWLAKIRGEEHEEGWGSWHILFPPCWWTSFMFIHSLEERMALLLLWNKICFILTIMVYFVVPNIIHFIWSFSYSALNPLSFGLDVWGFSPVSGFVSITCRWLETGRQFSICRFLETWTGMMYLLCANDLCFKKGVVRGVIRKKMKFRKTMWRMEWACQLGLLRVDFNCLVINEWLLNGMLFWLSVHLFLQPPHFHCDVYHIWQRCIFIFYEAFYLRSFWDNLNLMPMEMSITLEQAHWKNCSFVNII